MLITCPCDLAVTVETMTYSTTYLNNIKINNKPVILLYIAVRAARIENDQSELRSLTCQKLCICIFFHAQPLKFGIQCVTFSATTGWCLILPSKWLRWFCLFVSHLYLCIKILFARLRQKSGLSQCGLSGFYVPALPLPLPSSLSVCLTLTLLLMPNAKNVEKGSKDVPGKLQSLQFFFNSSVFCNFL